MSNICTDTLHCLETFGLWRIKTLNGNNLKDFIAYRMHFFFFVIQNFVLCFNIFRIIKILIFMWQNYWRFYAFSCNWFISKQCFKVSMNHNEVVSLIHANRCSSCAHSSHIITVFGVWTSQQATNTKTKSRIVLYRLNSARGCELYEFRQLNQCLHTA